MRAPVAGMFPPAGRHPAQREVVRWKVTAFDVELLYLAEKAGYRIGEVQVCWADRDVARAKARAICTIYGNGRADFARQVERPARRLQLRDPATITAGFQPVHIVPAGSRHPQVDG